MKIVNRNYDYYDVPIINNLTDLITLRYQNSHDDIAFSFTKNNEIVKKTFGDVYSDVNNLKQYFHKLYKNKHIALVGTNSYEWIITFLAIILSDNIVVVLDKDLDSDGINNLLKISNTKIIYYSNSYLPFINDMKIKSFKLENIIDYIEIGKEYSNKIELDENRCSAIFFTSGTTGPNKGVMLSEKNIASNIYGASSLFELSGSTVSLLPFHHAFGFITAILKPFYYGKETYINNSLKNIMKDFESIKPDTLFVVPAFIETFYKQIWRNVRKTKSDKKLKIAIKISNRLLKIGIDKRRKIFKTIHNSFGGNLRYIICGGAYLNPMYVKWFRSIGIEILNGYGITECSPVVSVNRNNYYKDGSIGRKCRNLDVKIIDGEIVVKGDSVMLGYYKNKKDTEKVLIDNYFHTGDLGYIDKDGFIFITGRKKNIIILSNGENISPEIIEEELLKDKGVCEVVVAEKNNMLVAYIYPNEEYFNDKEYFDNLIYKYNINKPKNHQISLVELRDTEFKKNNNRKILRDKIEE